MHPSCRHKFYIGGKLPKKTEYYDPIICLPIREYKDSGEDENQCDDQETEVTEEMLTDALIKVLNEGG